MAGQIGPFVRELRQARQMSIGRLAERAAVAKSTLSRWEAGAFQPRLPELEAVLAALEVSPAEREQALARVQAPRAVGRLRRELATGAETAGEDVGLLPAGGDLLRAMRRRRGLSQEQMAVILGVRPSTISYWEQSKTVPPPERLAAMCDLLGAQPGERALLAGRNCFLAPPLEVKTPALDSLEHRLVTLQGQIYAGEQAEIDLRCLTLASQLWPLTGRHRDARRLLSEVSATYAEWLRWQGRGREALQCAERVQELVRQDEPDCPVVWGLLTAIVVSAGVIAGGRARDSACQAVELLQRWLSAGATPQWEAAIYRDMVDHGVKAGHLEAAWEFSQCARAAAERTDDAGQIRIARKVQAGVLARMGRCREALAVMPAEEDEVFVGRLEDTVYRAELLLMLGDWVEAHRWVARAYDLMAAGEYPHWRRRADAVARQL